MTLHGTICQNPEYLALLIFLNSMMWVPSLSVSWCSGGRPDWSPSTPQDIHCLAQCSAQNPVHYERSLQCREDVSRDDQHRNGQESAAEADQSARPCQPWRQIFSGHHEGVIEVVQQGWCQEELLCLGCQHKSSGPCRCVVMDQAAAYGGFGGTHCTE